MMIEWRCEVTNNPVGTDTVMIGAPPCRCRGCRGFEMMRLATSFLCDEIDYMLLNKLGDPEKQHNVRWARKLGIDMFAPREGVPTVTELVRHVPKA